MGSEESLSWQVMRPSLACYKGNKSAKGVRGSVAMKVTVMSSMMWSSRVMYLRLMSHVRVVGRDERLEDLSMNDSRIDKA